MGLLKTTPASDIYRRKINLTQQTNTLIMKHCLYILEQLVPEEPIINEQKLRYIVSQISIWDYFGIPQANY